MWRKGHNDRVCNYPMPDSAPLQRPTKSKNLWRKARLFKVFAKVLTRSDSISISLVDIETTTHLGLRMLPNYFILARSYLLSARSYLLSAISLLISTLSILTSYSIRYRILPKYATGHRLCLLQSSYSRSISGKTMSLNRYPMLFI